MCSDKPRDVRLHCENQAGNVGIEYDYIWRTGDSSTFVIPAAGNFAATTVTANARTDVNMITARVNYKFGGPVIAKY